MPVPDQRHRATAEPLDAQAAWSYLRLITDNLPVIVAHCDRDARYLFVNRPYSARFGAEPETFVGRHLESVVGRAAYEALRPFIARVLAGEHLVFELEVPYENIGLRVMRCHYVPVAGSTGAIDSFIASVLDVTEHRRTERTLHDRESHFRSAFELSAVGQAMVGAEGVYLLVNDRYCQMTGYTRDELLRMHPQDITHPDDLARDDEQRSRLLRGETQNITTEKRYVRKSGDVIWVRVHATLFRSGAGRPLGAFSMIEDITEERRTAEQRELLFASERAARLSAEEANRTKDEFLASLSHELRTPLNVILGWTQALQRRAVAADRVEAALNALDRNARKQAQLVDDLLDVSRIAAGRLRLELQPVTVATVLEAALETVRPAAEAKRLRMTTEADPGVQIDADPIRLQQVFWNLLSNAVKFTPERGEIAVRVTTGDGQLVALVSDTGIGIDPGFVPRLFSRFEQADRSTTRPYDGLGLGLAIVRHLVELHGGTVQASSEGSGRGATFTVTLPIRTRAGALQGDGAQLA
jgi:PAS domain S-box-containing protein